jgi:hypothetical protein
VTRVIERGNVVMRFAFGEFHVVVGGILPGGDFKTPASQQHSLREVPSRDVRDGPEPLRRGRGDATASRRSRVIDKERSRFFLFRPCGRNVCCPGPRPTTRKILRNELLRSAPERGRCGPGALERTQTWGISRCSRYVPPLVDSAVTRQVTHFPSRAPSLSTSRRIGAMLI